MAALQHVGSPERGVLLLDSQSKVVFANQRASAIFSLPLDRLVGAVLPGSIITCPDKDEEVIDEVLECSLAESATFHRYSTPVYSADGQVAGRIEIYSDITARRQLEKEILDRNTELAELNKQLEEAQEQLIQSERLRALGEMAAGVAHDINNVLGIILGNTQLARRKLSPDDPALRSVEAIELAARDGAETVRRLRELGKPIDSSSHVPVSLNEVVEDVVRGAVPAWRATASSGGAGVSIETELAPDCTVLGNAAELREALANILLNAVQSVESNGHVVIRTSSASRTAELSVSDNGMGMNEETKKRVFDPFFTTRGAEGTGLGMSMVDAIAIRHKGKVIVESEQGKGTTVTLRLPVYQPS